MRGEGGDGLGDEFGREQGFIALGIDDDIWLWMPHGDERLGGGPDAIRAAGEGGIGEDGLAAVGFHRRVDFGIAGGHVDFAHARQ